MATPGGTKGACVGDLLLQESRRWDFFQAVRLWQLETGGRTAVGTGDEPDRETLRAFMERRVQEGLEVVPVSGSEGAGLRELRSALARLLPTDEELGGPGEATGVVVHRYDPAEEGFVIEREAGGVWAVEGRRVERLVAQTDFENEESAARFQRELARMGLVDKLREAGVEAGDTVRIGDIELEWDAEPGAWV